MVESTAQLVVIDNGQSTMKVGYAGEDGHHVYFDTTPGAMAGGRITDWDKMEAVWTEAFAKLEVAPDAAAGVVVTEAIFNP